MTEFLRYREPEYFDQRKDHWFLFKTVFLMRLSKVQDYYFDNYSSRLRAMSVESVSLSDLGRLNVQYRNQPLLNGVLTGKVVNLKHLSYLHVYWDRVPLKNERGGVQAMPTGFVRPEELQLPYKFARGL